jgi:hypothetical protein
VLRFAVKLGLLILFFISVSAAQINEMLSKEHSHFFTLAASANHFNQISDRDDSTLLPPDSMPPQINNTRLALVGGTLLTSMVAIHIYQQNGWWKNNRAPFHFQEDLVYGLWVDKIGHFYGGYLMGFLMSKSFEWADVPEKSALWLGAGGSLIFQSYVEIEDGFSKWGFDRVDWAFDVGGAAWNPLRHYVPFLKNFDLKWSYHPSALLGNPGGKGFKGQKHLMMDDYEGQTLWMGFKVRNLLPENIGKYWPPFLCIALGYGARDVANLNPYRDPYRVYFIALDLDMTEIIPRNTKFLQTLGEALNFVHFPMPAIRFGHKTILYGLYF